MRRQKGFYERFVKRPQDILLAILAITLLCPIMVIVALVVRVKIGTPIIYCQKRPGMNEAIFKMYKFRTMTNECDLNGNLLSDELRLTRIGRFLRSTSLDELPELWNIIKGDMSLIGPRPLLIQYLPLYNDHQKKRHLVRPGLSGLAQVNGRNAIDWNQKFDLDVAYVEEITFKGDWKIILKTLRKVFIREGINSAPDVTMEPFKGN